MAITLDELLGKNMTNSEVEQAPQFPSYENFKTSRNDVSQPVSQNERIQPRNNAYNGRNSSSVITEEQIRNYNAESPFVKPRNAEFQTRDFDFISSLQRPSFGENRDAFTRAREENGIAIKNTYSETNSFAKPTNSQNLADLHQFTYNDKDRLSERELMAKLEHSGANVAKINAAPEYFSQNETSSRSLKNVKENKVTEYSAEKKKAKLNTKGKVILAVYIAVIILVAVLIIVNAGDINRGTVAAPSSNSIVRTVSSVENNYNSSYNFESDEIHFMYENSNQI